MEQTPMRNRLLALLHEARAQQHSFINGLSQAERATIGTLDRWSAKDVVAHCTAWQERMLRTITALVAGEAPLTFDDVDHLNDQTWAEHRDRPWGELLTEAEVVYGRLIDCVRTLDQELLGTSSWRGQPLWRILLGNSYWHPQSHIAEFLLKQRGDLDGAMALQRTIAEGMGNFDGTPQLRGLACYNLACFLAQANQLGAALTELREALALNPDLRAWSREDRDLQPLHSLPAYQALYS